MSRRKSKIELQQLKDDLKLAIEVKKNGCSGDIMSDWEMGLLDDEMIIESYDKLLPEEAKSTNPEDFHTWEAGITELGKEIRMEKLIKGAYELDLQDEIKKGYQKPRGVSDL